MSWATLLAGLDERFATVAGIAAILDYEPTSVQATPLFYSLFEGYELTGEAGTKSRRYRGVHYLLVDWQEAEQAELELIPFVDAIPAAVEADPQLGGRIPNGFAEISSGEGVWVEIAGIKYRGIEFHSVADEG